MPATIAKHQSVIGFDHGVLRHAKLPAAFLIEGRRLPSGNAPERICTRNRPAKVSASVVLRHRTAHEKWSKQCLQVQCVDGPSEPYLSPRATRLNSIVQSHVFAQMDLVCAPFARKNAASANREVISPWVQSRTNISELSLSDVIRGCLTCRQQKTLCVGGAAMAGSKSGERPGKINSRLENLRNLAPAERLGRVIDATSLGDTERARLGPGALPLELANGMIENVIGTFELPVGIATNFTVNGRDYLIPMAVEEPSVVAAASYMARIVRKCGGFQTSSSAPIMRAQVQVLGVTDVHGARARVLRERDAILEAANTKDKVLISLGGGCRDVEVHVFEDTPVGPMMAVHLHRRRARCHGREHRQHDGGDGRAADREDHRRRRFACVFCRTCADLRIARAMVSVTPEALKTEEYNGERIARGIVEACAFAIVDPYRAATHNKGIMNGIDPVVVATGNDWRAIEAGAHVWASRSGRYTSLTNWEIDGKGQSRRHH